MIAGTAEKSPRKTVRFIDVTDDVLQAMVRSIVSAVDPEKIVLFGSHAKGTTSPESDIDLMIIEKLDFGPNRSRREELAKIRNALFDFLVPIDILVFSEAEEEDLKTLRCSVVATSATEGRVLYARERVA